MDISSAIHLRQVSLLSGEVLATESYRYPESGSAIVQLGDEELVMPNPEFLTILQNARADSRFPIRYWRGKDGLKLLGLGSAASVVPFAAFGNRKEVLYRGFNEILEHFYRQSDIPYIFFSMHFDPGSSHANHWSAFPAIHFSVPAILLQQSGEQKTVYFTGSRMNVAELRRSWSRISSMEPRHSTEDLNSMELSWNDSAYNNLVDSALDSIKNDSLSKVVLARECEIEAQRDFDTIRVLEELQNAYPDCYHYYEAPTAEQSFLSASPERLARVANGTIETTALAGTLDSKAKKGALLKDKKNLAEHAFVIAMMKDALNDICANVSVDEKPEEVQLANVRHLQTRISGSLSNGTGLLDAIAALHPTPAVCGTPSDTAMEFIRNHEKNFRGMYAGITGWLDHENNGEVSVAIRSGLISGKRATVFSGAGIVEGSVSKDENKETKTKAEAFISALREA
jgi:isochorismate synthase